MRTLEYKNWLKDKVQLGPTRDYPSRCARVERDLPVSLDDAYIKGYHNQIIECLEYSREDERLGKPAPGNIKFRTARIYDGMASLKTSVKTYFDFCAECPLDMQ